eukprot:CAMPEP_0178969740 /NCGR_PEP_ID=MMETSP0789-20121207/19056_1 /TAXON_ID=3005 /ORGANISM="Rhizosolenia setigera, Strain CCMP 1694" /LENGTH=410 /DNA_ID=CAMNT_0020655971 /DNA_START=235 /DNA_END=1465 /DNA_ORIENTATION=-
MISLSGTCKEIQTTVKETVEHLVRENTKESKFTKIFNSKIGKNSEEEIINHNLFHTWHQLSISSQFLTQYEFDSLFSCTTTCGISNVPKSCVERILSLPMHTLPKSKIRQVKSDILQGLYLRGFSHDYLACVSSSYYYSPDEVEEDSERDWTLVSICDKLSDLGFVDQALDILNRISSSDRKSSALHHICTKTNLFGANKNCDCSDSVTTDESKNCKQHDSQNEIESHTTLDKILKVANTFSDHYRDWFLESITRRVIKIGYYEKASEIICSVSDSDAKNTTLSCISELAYQKGDFPLAIKIASEITNIETKNHVLKNYCMKAVKRSDINQALFLVQSMTNVQRREKDHILEAIVIKVLQQDSIEKALEIASRICDRKLKKSLCDKINRKKREFHDAVELPHNYKDRKFE